MDSESLFQLTLLSRVVQFFLGKLSLGNVRNQKLDIATFRHLEATADAGIVVEEGIEVHTREGDLQLSWASGLLQTAKNQIESAHNRLGVYKLYFREKVNTIRI